MQWSSDWWMLGVFLVLRRQSLSKKKIQRNYTYCLLLVVVDWNQPRASVSICFLRKPFPSTVVTVHVRLNAAVAKCESNKGFSLVLLAFVSLGASWGASPKCPRKQEAEPWELRSGCPSHKVVSKKLCSRLTHTLYLLQSFTFLQVAELSRVRGRALSGSPFLMATGRCVFQEFV